MVFSLSTRGGKPLTSDLNAGTRAVLPKSLEGRASGRVEGGSRARTLCQILSGTVRRKVPCAMKSQSVKIINAFAAAQFLKYAVSGEAF